MSKVAKVVADPSGYFSGTQTTQSMMDPGGALIKSVTGSDIGNKIADPIGMFKGPDVSGDIMATQRRVDSQINKEKRRLAEETSEVERKKALLQRGGAGRSLLVKTSPTGVSAGGANNLGGMS